MKYLTDDPLYRVEILFSINLC